jgi:hypothetical protein
MKTLKKLTTKLTNRLEWQPDVTFLSYRRSKRDTLPNGHDLPYHEKFQGAENQCLGVKIRGTNLYNNFKSSINLVRLSDHRGYIIEPVKRWLYFFLWPPFIFFSRKN